LYAGDIAGVSLDEASTAFASPGLYQTQTAQFGKRRTQCKGGNAHSGGEVAFTGKLGPIFEHSELDRTSEAAADFLSPVRGFQGGERELLFPSLHRLLLANVTFNLECLLTFIDEGLELEYHSGRRSDSRKSPARKERR
jgi:hypothetical protein